MTLAGQFCYRGRVFTWAETLFIIEIPKNDQCKNGFWVPWWIDCDPDYLFVYLKSLLIINFRMNSIVLKLEKTEIDLRYSCISRCRFNPVEAIIDLGVNLAFL